MNTFNECSFKRMLDALPYKISEDHKKELANDVNYARLNNILPQLYSPYLIINIASNYIQVGDQLSPKVISNFEGHALLTSTSAFYNKRIDILLTNKPI